MAPQYLLMTKKHKNLSAEVVVVGVSAWLPGASYMGCRVGTESHLPHLPSQSVSVTPFLRPRSGSRASAKCSHIPFISPVSEQLLQGLFC